MNVTLQDIPSTETAPPDAKPSRIRAAVEADLDRRTVIRSVAALGMTLGVTALSWVTPGTSRMAEAVVGTYWGNCNVFSYDGVLCETFPYSSSYCGSDGWFRNGVYNGYRWTPITTCNGKNAWIWPSESIGYRCADGRRYTSTGSSTTLICLAIAYRR